MNQKIQCGLCSFGMSGSVFHGPLLKVHPSFELSHILERNHHYSKQLFPNAQLVEDLESLLAIDQLELVIVNVPDHLHYEFTKACLLAGKHVVVEKPFTLSYSEGKELLQLATLKNLMISVFQNRRWDSDFLTVKRIIESGSLGPIREVEIHYDRFRPVPPTNTWKEDKELGPGLLYNLGAHLIDQALVLFGRPREVFADLATVRPNGQITDYFNLILFYPNLRVILKSSYVVKESPAKYQIHGLMGSFIKKGGDPQEERLSAGWQADHPDIGVEPTEHQGWLYLSDSNYGEPVPSERGNYLQYYDGVAAEIQGRSRSAVSGSEGLQVIEIIEAAIQSEEEKQRIVLQSL